MKFYTGVGSRDTPHDIQDVMSSVAKKLAEKGWTLRSGGATGADTAFGDGWWQWKVEQRIDDSDIRAEIYLPWDNFNNHTSTSHGGACIVAPSLEAWSYGWEMAARIHPKWEDLKHSHRLLHARNAFQVLGRDLGSPSSFILYWAPIQGDSVAGGTRTAVELARRYDIPDYNLNNQKTLDRVLKWIRREDADV